MIGQVPPHARVLNESFNTCHLELLPVSDTRVQENMRRSKYTTCYNHFLLGYNSSGFTIRARTNFDDSKFSAVPPGRNDPRHLRIEKYVYIVPGMTEECSYPTAALKIWVNGILIPAYRRRYS